MKILDNFYKMETSKNVDIICKKKGFNKLLNYL